MGPPGEGGEGAGGVGDGQDQVPGGVGHGEVGDRIARHSHGHCGLTEAQSEQVHWIVEAVQPEVAVLGGEDEERQVDRHLRHGAAQGDLGLVLRVVNSLQ